MSGRTKRYTSPLSLLTILYGFFFFVFALDIFNVPHYRGGTLIEYFEEIVICIVLAFVTSLFPFMKRRFIELLFIFVYMLSGGNLMLHVALFIEYLAWKNEWNMLIIDILNSLWIIYVIYYLIRVFWPKLIKVVTVIVLSFLVIEAQVLIKQDEFTPVDEILFPLPNWVFEQRALLDKDLDSYDAPSIDSHTVISDFSKDGVRDIALLLYDEGKPVIVSFHFVSDQVEITDICPFVDCASQEVVDFGSDEADPSALVIKFKDGTSLRLKWNGSHFYPLNQGQP